MHYTKIMQSLLLSGLVACSFSSLADDTVRTLVAEKGQVHIEAFDQGNGHTIVILPSKGRGAGDYDEVARYLAADGYRVIRPEPRGVKGSRAPMDTPSLHDFASDVALIMDKAKTGPSVVVGHAWGSQPARMLAVDRPDLVNGIVLAAASIGKLPAGSSEKPYGRMVEAIKGAGDYSLPESKRIEYLKEAFFAPGNDPRPWLTGWYDETHKAQDHARDSTPVEAYWSAGDVVPILDLQGEHDAVVIPNILKSMLGSRVEHKTIANAGHAMAPERPREMADAISAFAKRVYSSN
ncbi:alpha/beta hydrolase [Pseudomonas argentinensis]|uniref:Pimeloyl-ACP methyl ester carboxylesterase n=1 Tax=Phytopseudomonas argentinensis TaxID=289370 RepID=A0A1I3N8E9_9GAMM|nr:alpha/beta hydrolase [Pseudomonas argentinensis]KAB0550129.1 alpha/beta hydrolase [Pseudomonas argentinensis]SFJ05096.1 Pimeloyl-ACP methyl ester carboxylesterase [Pseudomonas argentinensis]